ncbi:s49 (protease IV) family peptidase (macronuclear) [Tetrahymena thermophila SB210]|nr:s49 (protease IV) family peptidase [Tetrahymena thermophila SB210]EAR81016.1 s49 (protease IV) family peptidase [Tetrahymena thermophila SB210]|eukprot:XP_001028679.1 s49 (protease IV) family peptidase [Tetrahymena thermophila SB210]
MKNYLLESEYDLKSSVIQTRAQKFHDLKLSNEQVNKELLEKGMIEAEQAKQIGLIDGIKTFEELAHEQYHGVKILDAIPTGSFTNNLLKSNTLFSNSFI